MSIIIQRRSLLSVALLGIATLASLGKPASAKTTRDREIPQVRSTDWSPTNYDSRNGDQNNGDRDNRDRNDRDRDDRDRNDRDRDDRDRNDRDRNDRDRNDRDRNDRDRNDRDRDHDRDHDRNNRDRFERERDERRRVHRSNLRGTIVSFRCPEDFELRVGCEVYRIHPTSRTPRALSCGDYVEINGDQYHGNDIDNANVSLLGNR